MLIPTTVMRELTHIKDRKKSHNSTSADRQNAKMAWEVLVTLNDCILTYSTKVYKIDNEKYKIPDSTQKGANNIKNDHKLMALADDISRKNLGKVHIVHNDVDFAVYSGVAITIAEYFAKRNKIADYTDIDKLDKEFNNLESLREIIKRVDINAYLENGATLLINTIKCNMPEQIKARGGVRIPDRKVIEKIKFLLDNGADLNKNDNGYHCLPPLSHSIQLRESYGFDIFKLLIERDCDINKASRDDSNPKKIGGLNEGNTPLMIACFHSKKKFIHMLCERDEISINQQDNNGFTALIKCALKRYETIKQNKPHELNDELYEYIRAQPKVDISIRDRNNHTAQDWIKRGDFLKQGKSYKENEKW
ncbi:hypothetical protein CCY99_01110 [Helicobacter sp. 16-1353]|nr:hypothetical protein CCY99_01110 [Helicobacter sp. 16-1353]